MFYRLLTELSVDSVNSLCQRDKSFRTLCRSREFWEAFWKLKIPYPLPEGDVKVLKREYFVVASFVDLADFILKNPKFPEFFEFKGTKMEILNQLGEYPIVDYESENDDERESIELISKIFLLGAEVGNLDCLLFGVNKGYKMRLRDVEEFEKYQRRRLVDRLLSLLNREQLLSLFSDLNLSIIISLPRVKNDCSPDIIKVVHEETQIINSRYFTDAILTAAIKDCIEVFDYLVDQMLLLKKKRILIREIAMNLVDARLITYLDRFSGKLDKIGKKIVEQERVWLKR